MDLVPRTRRRSSLAFLSLCLATISLHVDRASAGDLFIDAGRGPVRVYIPSSYDPETPAPLILLLHGYGSSGAGQESYMRFAPLVEEYGFLYAHPDGTIDNGGSRFWNATDACCDFFGSGVDDSGYLAALIDSVETRLSVDPRRIHLIGHSNGGFMSYRMACDHPGTIAAMASLAGATWDDPADCAPDQPVHVLQIHGTADTVIRYTGGVLDGHPYPAAVETVEQWAAFGGCSLVPETDIPPLDLDASLPGAETTVSRYAEFCNAGGSAELWTIVGGSHVPNLSAAFSRLVVEFLLAHPKLEPADVAEGKSVISLRAWPTPFIDGCWIEMAVPRDSSEPPGPLRVVVNDAGGRRIALLGVAADRTSSGNVGSFVFRWDGVLENGEPAPAGVYFATAVTGDAVGTIRLIRMR